MDAETGEARPLAPSRGPSSCCAGWGAPPPAGSDETDKMDGTDRTDGADGTVGCKADEELSWGRDEGLSWRRSLSRFNICCSRASAMSPEARPAGSPSGSVMEDTMEGREGFACDSGRGGGRGGRDGFGGVSGRGDGRGGASGRGGG